jgi:hypothetical protein
MIWDPAWIAAVLSGIAAVLAAFAWLKFSKSDPVLVHCDGRRFRA